MICGWQFIEVNATKCDFRWSPLLQWVEEIST